MNYDKNLIQRFAARLRRLWTFGGAATLLLTLFNVAVHGPRHLLLHLGLHAWLRWPLLRGCVVLLVGPITALMFVFFMAGTWDFQPTTAADVLPVTGTVVGFAEDEYDNLLILLDSHENGFLVHADAKPLFDQARFLREVQLGTRVELVIHQERRAALDMGDTIVVYEVRSDATTYVAFADAAAAEQQARGVEAPRLIRWLGMLALACAVQWAWDGWRSKRRSRQRSG